MRCVCFTIRERTVFVRHLNSTDGDIIRFHRLLRFKGQLSKILILFNKWYVVQISMSNVLVCFSIMLKQYDTYRTLFQRLIVENNILRRLVFGLF